MMHLWVEFVGQWIRTACGRLACLQATSDTAALTCPRCIAAYDWARESGVEDWMAQLRKNAQWTIDSPTTGATHGV